jgi:hypothetical protein
MSAEPFLGNARGLQGSNVGQAVCDLNRAQMGSVDCLIACHCSLTPAGDGAGCASTKPPCLTQGRKDGV